MDIQELVKDLKSRVEEGIIQVEKDFLPAESTTLNYKVGADKWSVLECIEHLNRYNRYYNHHLEVALEANGAAQQYKPGWLGNYFVKTLGPEYKKPMKTKSYLNPSGSQLDKSVLVEYLDHQRHLLQLLTRARHSNLNRRAIKVEVMPLIRIKTGDALRFLIAHQERHLQQAERSFKLGVPAKGYPRNTPVDQ